MDKVIGGTPRGSRSLCQSCRFAHVIRGFNMQEEIYCLRLGGSQQAPIVRFPVAECSAYENKATPSLYQMQDIAWTVTSRNRGIVGFAADEKIEVHIEPPDPQKQQPAMPITGKTKP